MFNGETVRLVSFGELPGKWQQFAEPLMRTGRLSVHDDCEETGCPHNVNILTGYGREEYPFPTPDELADQAIAYIERLERAYARQHAREVAETNSREEQQAFVSYVRRHGLPNEITPRGIAMARQMRQMAEGKPLFSPKLRSAVEEALSKLELKPGTPTTGLNASIDLGVGAMAEIFHDGRYDAIIAAQFDPLMGACNWALNNMPEKYHHTAKSILDHLIRLKEIYGGALPRVINYLAAKNPKMSEEELLHAAVSVLNEQLSEILYTLSVWTEAFGQERDGLYPELLYVIFFVEQALYIMTDDAVKSQIFSISDVFTARYGAEGNFTMPNAKGPRNAHAINVPLSQRKVLVVISLALNAHEFGHDFRRGIKGLLDELTEVVVTAIQEDYTAGKYKFTSPTIKLGKQEIEMIAMLIQIYAQTLSETDPDVIASLLLGPGFGYAMLLSFGGFNLEGAQGVNSNATLFNTNGWLRRYSRFLIGDEGQLILEPHMPDVLRALILCDLYRLLGFVAEAEEIEAVVAKAGGFPAPTDCVWFNGDPDSQFKFKIKVPIVDARQVSPTVVNAIVNKPLQRLGGKSTGQLTTWTKEDQTRVDVLVANIMAGSSDIPAGISADIWATTIATVGPTAVWRLLKANALPPLLTFAYVEVKVRAMMDKVMAQHKAKEADKPRATVASKDGAADAGKDAGKAETDDQK
jgi:hypothetical protein